MRHMNASPCLKRLWASLGVLCGMCLLALIRGTPSDAVTGTWFWLAMLSDAFRWDLDLDPYPVLLGALTLTILFVPATRRIPCILATAWFVLNASGALWFLSVHDGHS